jgi:DegV family protein with EDD domain
MLRIVTDGAADILPAWKKEYGIDVIPVNIMFGERSYLQYEELDVEYLEDIKHRVRVILTLDTLEYAKMSGRVKTLQAALASVLNVKPIAVLRDGDLTMAEPVRTRKASLDRVIEMAKEEYGDDCVDLAVVHARDPKSGEELLAEAQKHFNHKETMIGELSISVVANLGSGTVGLVVYPTEQKG